MTKYVFLVQHFSSQGFENDSLWSQAGLANGRIERLRAANPDEYYTCSVMQIDGEG